MKIRKWVKLIGNLLVIGSIAGCMLLRGNTLTGKIVFQSIREGNHGLSVMNSDGSDLRELTSSPGNSYISDTNSGFILPPDGKQIAFNGDSKIYTIDIDSGVKSNLTKNQGKVDSFAWSPDGKQIAFVSEQDAIVLDANRGLSTNNIYIMDANGTNVRRLTVDNKTDQYGELSWSPDGQKLVFGMSSQTRYGGFFPDGIQLMTLSDANFTTLTNPSDTVQDPSGWSPDGKHIMYFVMGSMLGNVYVMNADGTNQVPLSNSTLGIVLNASWSPDGERVVFSTVKFQVQDNNRKYYIYIVNADGTNLVVPSKDSSPYDTSPSWSPDGRYIVFASKRDGGKSHLYIMNADGSNQRRLTNGPGEEAAPIWLP